MSAHRALALMSGDIKRKGIRKAREKKRKPGDQTLVCPLPVFVAGSNDHRKMPLTLLLMHIEAYILFGCLLIL